MTHTTTQEPQEYKVVTSHGVRRFVPTLTQAMETEDAEFISGPVETPTKGPAFRTNWSLEGGRWEGFISLV